MSCVVSARRSHSRAIPAFFSPTVPKRTYTHVRTYGKISRKYSRTIRTARFFFPRLPLSLSVSIVFKISRPSLTILLAKLPLHFLRAASQFTVDLTGKTSFYMRALSWSPNDIRPALGAWKIIHPSVFLAFRGRTQSCPNLIGKRKKKERERKEEVKNKARNFAQMFLRCSVKGSALRFVVSTIQRRRLWPLWKTRSQQRSFEKPSSTILDVRRCSRYPHNPALSL